MTLFEFNMIAMVISCVLLVGGYTANRTRLGGVAMGLGLVGLLVIIRPRRGRSDRRQDRAGPGQPRRAGRR